MEKTLRRDWDNQDMASPVLHFDLTMADIRDYLVKIIEADNEQVRIQYCQLCFEYVRGLQDGNRFLRQKPKLIKSDTTD